MTILAGLCSITFRDLSADDVVALAAEAGLAGIEWGADRHVPPGSDAGSVAGRCADAGLACPSYGTYLFAGRASATEVDAACATAVELGATNLRVWAPDEAGAADVADIADQAADRGLTVSLEFHPGTRTETAASTLALLAEADRDAGALVANRDFDHLTRSMRRHGHDPPFWGVADGVGHQVEQRLTQRGGGRRDGGSFRRPHQPDLALRGTRREQRVQVREERRHVGLGLAGRRPGPSLGAL